MAEPEDRPASEPPAPPLLESAQLLGAADAFHRAIDSIRELLSLVSPHLKDGMPLVSAFEGLTRRQSLTALIFLIVVNNRRDVDESQDDSGEEDLFDDGAEDELVELTVPDSSGNGEAAPEKADDDLLEILKTARANELSDDDLQAIVDREFDGARRQWVTFVNGLQGLMLTPSKRLILNGSMLMSAVATFETLLARVLTYQLNRFPALVDASEPRFSLGDLKEFGSIEDAVDAAVDARVDSLMHEDFKGWEAWFEKQAGIALADLCIDRLRAAEAIQRRHLLVHATGRVSKQYLQRLDLDKPPVGTVLRVKTRYLERVLDEFDVLGMGLAFAAAHRWVPDEREQIIKEASDHAYALLQAERLQAAEKLCDIGCSLGPTESWSATAMRVNRWIAMKRARGLDAIRTDVEAWDVSALAPEFALARSALLGDHDAVFAAVPKLIADDVLSAEALEAWPLLADLRQDPRYPDFLREHDLAKDLGTPSGLRPLASEASDSFTTPDPTGRDDGGSQS